MFSNKPEIAVISAEVNDGDYSPQSLRFHLDVDKFPTVSADTAHADSGKAVSVNVPVSSDVLARIGELQQQRLAGRVETDFRVTANDGRDGEIEYEGFVAAPILDITKVSTQDRISSVGEVALLDALDLGIYRGGYELARAESGNSLKPIKSAEDGDLPKVLSEITDVLVENFGTVLADEYMPVAQEMLRLQHGVNTDGPLDMWKTILDDSDVKFKSWGAAFDAAPEIARALSEKVKDMLEAQTSGFWEQIRTLMSTFQMYYVPSFNGAGRFERADKKTGEPSGRIKISASGLSVADGSTRLLPLGGVVMMARGTPTERQEAAGDPDVPRVVAYYPDPLLPGFFQREYPPFWLMREEGIPILGSEVKNTRTGQVVLSLEARAAARTAGRIWKSKIDTLSQGIMTELCEVRFRELQLEQSTAVLTMPLDFKMNEHIGKRVTVEVGRDSFWRSGGEFTAFVAGVSHTVALQQGSKLSSTTEVRLTHTKYF